MPGSAAANSETCRIPGPGSRVSAASTQQYRRRRGATGVMSHSGSVVFLAIFLTSSTFLVLDKPRNSCDEAFLEACIVWTA